LYCMLYCMFMLFSESFSFLLTNASGGRKYGWCCRYLVRLGYNFCNHWSVNEIMILPHVSLLFYVCGCFFYGAAAL